MDPLKSKAAGRVGCRPALGLRSLHHPRLAPLSLLLLEDEFNQAFPFQATISLSSRAWRLS